VVEQLIHQRQLKRHHLKNFVDVLDAENKVSLGRLANIHLEGLMVIGEPLDVNSIYQIIISLPYSINQSRHIRLGIECLWCQENHKDDDTMHWSGAKIIDISPISKASLASLINIREQ